MENIHSYQILDQRWCTKRVDRKVAVGYSTSTRAAIALVIETEFAHRETQ